MIKIKEEKNSTYLDELGAKYSIYREDGESLEDYYLRIVKASRKPFDTDIRTFYESLGYITKHQDKNIIRIEIDDAVNARVLVSSAKIYIWSDKDADPIYEKELKDIKFAKTLFTEISALDGFNVSKLDLFEDYLKVENLMICDTDQNYMYFEGEGNAIELPENHIEEIQDFNNVFEEKVLLQEDIIYFDKFILNEETNTLHKYTANREAFTFNYKAFPLDLKWLPIKAAFFDDADFDFLTLKKNNQNTPYNLSQKGAKIYNQLLKINNTYWGR